MLPENSATTELATDVFAPAAIECLFWRSRYLIDSRVIAHLPFVFWTCAALRPRRIVVIGAADGGAHFGLCQAIEKLSSQGRCTGYGFWKEGCDENSAPTVPLSLLNHQEMFYEDISRLAPCDDLDVLADSMPEDSLDILWLDLSAEGDGLCQRAEVFARALNDNGIMFIHGVEDVPANSASEAAIKRLLSSHRCIRFGAEAGLLVVVWGKHSSERLEALFSLSSNSMLMPQVENVFRRVGSGLLSTARLGAAKTLLRGAQARLSEVEVQSESAKSALDSLNAAYDLRQRKVAELESDCYDARLQIADLMSQLAAIESERVMERSAQQSAYAELDQKRTALEEEATNLRSEVLRLESRNSELLRSSEAKQTLIKGFESKINARVATERQTRFRETATLTRMLEDQKAYARERKDKEIARLQAQYEESELHRQIIAQLSRARISRHKAFGQRVRLRPNRRAISEIEEEIRLVEASDLFDANWYVAFYPDVAEAGVEPAQHFVIDGVYELRNPGPKFDSFEYHRAYPDVAAEQIGAFIHYLRHGRAENRQTFPVGEHR